MASKKHAALSPEDALKVRETEAREEIRRSTSSMQSEIEFISKVIDKSVMGTSLSKFVGFYSPAFEVCTQKARLDDNLKDETLTAALEADRKSKSYGHRKKRDWMKTYMDECVKYAAVTKGK